MIIQTVSYRIDIPSDTQNKLNIDIINKSQADILLFPRWSIKNEDQLELLTKAIDNRKIFAILELKELVNRKLKNCLFSVQNGEINFHSVQLFTTSNEINNNAFIGKMLLDQLLNSKLFTPNNKCIRVLQCGEINILRNEQGNNNRVKFRLDNDVKLSTTFNTILKTTDIFLNPQHTIMGNQGKMSRRRSYLSANNGVYASTTNVENKVKPFKNKSISYIYYNGKALPLIKLEEGKFHAVFQSSITN
jgi:hypothetical protein